MALTRNEIKLIKSLDKKKYRKQTGLFVAEGIKIIRDLLQSDFEVEKLYLSEEAAELLGKEYESGYEILDKKDFERISFQKTPQNALALVKTKSYKFSSEDKGLYLVLDNIQDPGNLGTILRLADWFGLDAVLCTSDTVDMYNPKVVQSAMGSIFRVKTIYMETQELSGLLKTNSAPVYGTFLEGENIYTAPLSTDGFIIMGNEAHGIGNELENTVNHKITIPAFKEQAVESLNVAVATAVICSEFKRRTLS